MQRDPFHGSSTFLMPRGASARLLRRPARGADGSAALEPPAAVLTDVAQIGRVFARAKL